MKVSPVYAIYFVTLFASSGEYVNAQNSTYQDFPPRLFYENTNLNDPYEIPTNSLEYDINSLRYSQLNYTDYSNDLSYRIYIDIMTSDGQKYLTYTPQDYDAMGNGNYIYFGLGKYKSNGLWHTFVRDIQADLIAAQPGVELIEINGFLIRGNARVDDVKLISIAPDGYLDVSVYEDAEDGTTHRWTVYDNTPSGAVIYNVDDDLQGRVIGFQSTGSASIVGNTTANGYRLSTSNGVKWHDTDHHIISWKQRSFPHYLYQSDSDGVPMFWWQGQFYYHPVLIVQYTLPLLAAYHETKHRGYIDKAEVHARKLIETSIPYGDAIYFPYNFDFPLHGNEDWMMEAPWYSGMAQGQVLSVFARLYQITGENVYLENANKIFNSFLNIKNFEDKPWVTYIDGEGYLWIEEYPQENPNNTLNGFIFGIFGLYDYFLITRSETAKKLLQASITTIRDHISQFRVNGQPSYYCLRHKIQSETYHRIHTSQLGDIYNTVLDPYFQMMETQFYNDFH